MTLGRTPPCGPLREAEPVRPRVETGRTGEPVRWGVTTRGRELVVSLGPRDDGTPPCGAYGGGLVTDARHLTLGDRSPRERPRLLVQGALASFPEGRPGD